MCGGVYFQQGAETVRIFYPNPQAVLPILKKDGYTLLLPWGRRQQEVGQLPATGWARLDAIYRGQWDAYFPKPVKIPVLRFMEKDLEGHSHWYDLQKGQFLQGLVARLGQEQRVYVVTIEPELEDAYLHNRWPRVVQRGERSRYVDWA